MHGKLLTIAVVLCVLDILSVSNTSTPSSVSSSRSKPPLTVYNKAILFQLGALPITMCRLIISTASNTFVNTIIPFNEMVKSHIAIGYTLVVLLFFTIVIFVTFFAVNCADLCKNFTSEIMITGYVIFGMFLSVAVTSYYRFKIPYRVFYYFHHLVFLTYIVTIIHTFDVKQRSVGGRSQTFKWFTASILLYITDRASMYLNHRFSAHILGESTVVHSAGGKKMIILQVSKPNLFHFQPGQFVYLKIPSIDNSWHPFSVSSSTDAGKLVFYIEVFSEKSWTYRLFETLMSGSEIGAGTDIEIMGPYGTSLGKQDDYSHGVVIGAGTGEIN